MTGTPAPAVGPTRAVVFDLDDTLYLERDYVRSGYRAVAERLARRRTGLSDLSEWMWARFLTGQTANMFNAVSDHFQLALSAQDIAGLVRLYRQHRPTISPDPEAAEALRALRGRVKLGLLSDGYLPGQQYKLDALGLAGAFQAVVFTEALGRESWKPSPAGYRRIAEQLGVAHAACAYVADNPAKDFLTPNALGWRTVQWRREGQIHADDPAPQAGEPQYLARDCRELLVALGLSE